MVGRSSSSQTIVRAKSNHKPILKQYGVETHRPVNGGRSSSATSSRQKNRLAKPNETTLGVTSPSDKANNAHWMTWKTGDLQPPGLQTIHAIRIPPPNKARKGRSSSATSSRQKNRLAKPDETTSGVTSPSDKANNAHWMTWKTGDLQPPGLQTIHAIRSPPPNKAHKGGSGLLNFRSSSATPSQQHNRPAKCHETAWGVTDPSDNTDNTHWMTWNTGDLQPPGLQTIHAIPSPQPSSGYGQKGFISPKLTREPTPKQPTPPLVRPASKSMSITNSAYSPRNIKAANKKYETAPHPHFRSWHTKGCDNYEADVTYNMLQHLYGGKARELDRMRRTRLGRYEHPINFERRIINGTYKSLERGKDRFKKLYRLSNSSAGGGGSAMQRAPMDYYPVSRHQSRSGVGRTDHTASSFFQYTQPSVKSSFVIHPQFVSEHCEFSKQLKSTKNLSHLTAARGDNAFRYGSSRSAV